MRTDSPKFPDTYAIESTLSKRPMAEFIEFFFKKIHYEKYFLLIFFYNFALSKSFILNEM